MSYQQSIVQHFSRSAFFLVSETTNCHFYVRAVYKFKLNDEPSSDGFFISASKTLCDFFKKYVDYVATFQVDIEYLSINLRTRKFLTINGLAVCLTEEPDCLPQTPTVFVDHLFSQTILRQPVRCSEGHFLELPFVLYWVQKRGDTCPAGNHSIGELSVYEKIQQAILRWRFPATPEDIRQIVVFQQQGATPERASEGITPTTWREKFSSAFRQFRDNIVASFEKTSCTDEFPRVVNLLDPKDLANAYTILEITQEPEKGDINIVEEKYRHKLQILQSRKERLPPLFAAQYQMLIQNLDAARTTLVKKLQK